jgi:hypothetical protein
MNAAKTPEEMPASVPPQMIMMSTRSCGPSAKNSKGGPFGQVTAIIAPKMNIAMKERNPHRAVLSQELRGWTGMLI